MLRTISMSMLLTVLVGCSSTPGLPDTFIDPQNLRTAEVGRQLMVDGQKTIDEAQSEIKRGEAMIEDGRAKRRSGEAVLSRGREALRSAAMAEEAERLLEKARLLRQQALKSGS